MKKTTLTTLATTLILSIIPAAFGVEYESPRTLGLGGSGRAAPVLNDSIYLNPSSGSFLPSYSFFGGYTSYNTGRNYNFSIQDARNELFQAGAGFTKRDQNLSINIGASKIAVERLGVGIGSKILLDQNGHWKTTEMSLSASYIALPWMYCSLMIDNLLEGADRRALNLYRTFYTSFKFLPDPKISVFADPFYSPSYSGGNKAGIGAGIEIGVLSDFYLRMGKFQDKEVPHLNERGSGFGLGLGWMGPKINIEYAQSRTLTRHGGGAMDTAHAGNLTVFY